MLRLHVPEELSLAAVRSLEDTSIGGIRTSTTLIGVLDRIAESEDPTQLIAPISGDGPDDDTTVWTTRPPVQDKSRKRKLIVGVSVLGAATLAVLIWIGTLLVGFFSDDTSAASGPTAVATPPASPGAPPNAAPPQPAAPIKPAAVVVYNVKGDPDNARRAKDAADGNQKTVWRTSKYKQQFPALKPGIGLIAAFAEPVRFATIAIDSPSTGTVVEIRSAPSDKPNLDDTKLIGQATLSAGHTDIQLSTAEPTQFVIIWITQLGEGNVSEISEVGFVRAQ
jgi:hypothetical protein